MSGVLRDRCMGAAGFNDATPFDDGFLSCFGGTPLADDEAFSFFSFFVSAFVSVSSFVVVSLLFVSSVVLTVSESLRAGRLTEVEATLADAGTTDSAKGVVEDIGGGGGGMEMWV